MVYYVPTYVSSFPWACQRERSGGCITFCLSNGFKCTSSGVHWLWWPLLPAIINMKPSDKCWECQKKTVLQFSMLPTSWEQEVWYVTSCRKISQGRTVWEVLLQDNLWWLPKKKFILFDCNFTTTTSNVRFLSSTPTTSFIRLCSASTLPFRYLYSLVCCYSSHQGSEVFSEYTAWTM